MNRMQTYMWPMIALPQLPARVREGIRGVLLEQACPTQRSNAVSLG